MIHLNEYYFNSLFGNEIVLFDEDVHIEFEYKFMNKRSSWSILCEVWIPLYVSSFQDSGNILYSLFYYFLRSSNLWRISWLLSFFNIIAWLSIIVNIIFLNHFMAGS